MKIEIDVTLKADQSLTDALAGIFGAAAVKSAEKTPVIQSEADTADKPARTRRTKAEIEAEKVAGAATTTADTKEAPEAPENSEGEEIKPEDFKPITDKLIEIKGDALKQAKKILIDHGVQKSAELFTKGEDPATIRKVYESLKALIPKSGK